VKAIRNSVANKRISVFPETWIYLLVSSPVVHWIQHLSHKPNGRCQKNYLASALHYNILGSIQRDERDLWYQTDWLRWLRYDRRLLSIFWWTPTQGGS